LCDISLKCEREQIRAFTPAPAFFWKFKGKNKIAKKEWFFVLGLPDLEHLLLQVAKKEAVWHKNNFTVLLYVAKSGYRSSCGWFTAAFLFMAKFSHFSTKKLGNFCFTSVNLE
jgi:hypothetical protein